MNGCKVLFSVELMPRWMGWRCVSEGSMNDFGAVDAEGQKYYLLIFMHKTNTQHSAHSTYGYTLHATRHVMALRSEQRRFRAWGLGLRV
jgi:hypothetical protein